MSTRFLFFVEFWYQIGDDYVREAIYILKSALCHRSNPKKETHFNLQSQIFQSGKIALLLQNTPSASNLNNTFSVVATTLNTVIQVIRVIWVCIVLQMIRGTCWESNEYIASKKSDFFYFIIYELAPGFDENESQVRLIMLMCGLSLPCQVREKKKKTNFSSKKWLQRGSSTVTDSFACSNRKRLKLLP